MAKKKRRPGWVKAGTKKCPECKKGELKWNNALSHLVCTNCGEAFQVEP